MQLFYSIVMGVPLQIVHFFLQMFVENLQYKVIQKSRKNILNHLTSAVKISLDN